jgi:peptide deformylase
MALLNILNYPDKRLHTVAKPVRVVDERIRQLVADMTETMYEAPGVGLAATQVDVHERVVVIDVSEDKNDLRVLINPEILAKSTRPTKKAAFPCLGSMMRLIDLRKSECER